MEGTVDGEWFRHAVTSISPVSRLCMPVSWNVIPTFPSIPSNSTRSIRSEVRRTCSRGGTFCQSSSNPMSNRRTSAVSMAWASSDCSSPAIALSRSSAASIRVCNSGRPTTRPVLKALAAIAHNRSGASSGVSLVLSQSNGSPSPKLNGSPSGLGSPVSGSI